MYRAVRCNVLLFTTDGSLVHVKKMHESHVDVDKLLDYKLIYISIYTNNISSFCKYHKCLKPEQNKIK